MTKDERKQEIIRLAKAAYEDEGTCEIEPDARISETDENGAYVQVWVWISFLGTKLDKGK